VNSPDAVVRFQASSSTLIVDTDVESSDGLRYDVRSFRPGYTAEQLQGAAGAVPQDVAEQYTKLPSDFSATARSTAEQIVVDAGATTAYAKALALQDHFQSGEYTYDLTVPGGHDEAAIDEFLAIKRGYCEQFAGTYAAMARSIGLPARVAVGFTPGDADQNDPTLYRVNGKHAHAWPEVFIGEYGWVAFEPTPGRGAPGAESWTGLQEQQDSTVAPTPSTSTTVVAGTDPTNSSVPDPGELATTTTLAAFEDPTVEAGEDPTSAFDSPAVRVATGAGLVLVVLGLYAGAMVLLAATRHRRRRERATTDRAKVQVAWQESIEALELIGTRAKPSETHEEFARRAQESVAGTGTALLDLAHDVDIAAYAPEREAQNLAARAERSSTVVVEAARAKVTLAQRWRAVLDPRPHLPKPGTSSRHRASSGR
jgi:transglutaminase-like putative cysteine protease